MRNLKVWLVLMLTVLAFGAEAQRWRYDNRGQDRNQHMNGLQRHIVDMHDQMFQGHKTISLKRKLKNKYVNLQGKQLVAVNLVAKTMGGRGTATLSVGHESSYPQTINGNRHDFHLNAPYTYDRVKINNPAYNSQGKWQLELNGKFKVKKIVIITKAKKAKAKKSITLKFYGEKFKGESSIALKRQLKSQNPYLNLNKFKLVKVKLVAKSKAGYAKAKLRVGHDKTSGETIYGNPYEFRSNAAYTFDTIQFHNPSYDSHGKWQILLKGAVKVKEITVVLKKKGQGGHGNDFGFIDDNDFGFQGDFGFN
ncbi:MAG: hypothetical protein ACPGJV_00020 [Bacteriovoracaceae bacterium]